MSGRITSFKNHTKSNYENGTAYTYGGATACNAGQCDNHVLTSVGTLKFKYDKQGNRLSEKRNNIVERNAEYTAYDKP